MPTAVGVVEVKVPVPSDDFHGAGGVKGGLNRSKPAFFGPNRGFSVSRGVGFMAWGASQTARGAGNTPWGVGNAARGVAGVA